MLRRPPNQTIRRWIQFSQQPWRKLQQNTHTHTHDDTISVRPALGFDMQWSQSVPTRQSISACACVCVNGGVDVYLNVQTEQVQPSWRPPGRVLATACVSFWSFPCLPSDGSIDRPSLTHFPTFKQFKSVFPFAFIVRNYPKIKRMRFLKYIHQQYITSWKLVTKSVRQLFVVMVRFSKWRLTVCFELADRWQLTLSLLPPGML